MAAPMSDEKEAYETIKRYKEKFGTFHKSCFHIHTPASYDYKLLADWTPNSYRKASEQDIFDICKKRKVIPEMLSLESITLEGAYSCYLNKKELFSYLLLADAILTNNIEIVVVTDHHTVDGVEKLKTVIDELFHMKKYEVYPDVILGIEISCADKNHVVGIFENSQKTINKIKVWLNDELLSLKDGTYETSIEVLEFIKSINGIGYLAHLDNSNIFKEKFSSGAYKKKLFSDEVLQLIGLADSKNLNTVKNNMKTFRPTEIKAVIDNDAHDIDSICSKTFWIKGSKRDYAMIKEAIDDYDISVSFENEQLPQQYIKGIYIENAEKGFLSGNGNNAFCLSFSKALNCLIGGRGTGKSTVLELLEYILSQRCDSEERLDFICLHGNAWLLYEYNGEEYLIEMIMPVKRNTYDSILRCFGQNKDDKYGYRYHYNQNEVKEYALKSLLKVSKVFYNNDEWSLETVTNKREMLNRFFDVRYSVNSLVNTASGEKINDFIYDTLFKNQILSKPEDVIRFKRKSGLIKTLDDVQDVLQKRKKEVCSVIEPFNENQNNVLRIIYTQNGVYSEPDFATWIFGNRYKERAWYKKYNITNGDIVDYLLKLHSNLGIFDFLKLVVNKDVDKACSVQNILDFCTELNQEMVDNGITSLNIISGKEVITNVFKDVITDDNIYMIIEYLKKYVSNIERFSLEFNINNKEGNMCSPMYKPIGTLSLGQKVVAMLSFVLGYSEYSKDYRPLIIDQPEDNLDNQYIYKNLVKQLRLIKEKRQVIIATHNATIVTNAKAEQVCVMISDNKHGWVETTGYPGEKRIKKQIINHLEGGEESFLHKLNVYQDALEIKVNK